MNEEWDGKVRFTPDYVPMNPDPHNFMRIVAPIGTNEMIATSSDAGWSSFQKQYPNACPECGISDGLDSNQKCQYCEYDNSLVACERCGKKIRKHDERNHFPLCWNCNRNDMEEAQRKREEEWAKQRVIEEEKERIRKLRWRPSVRKAKDGVIVDLDVELDWYDPEDAEPLPKKLTWAQAQSLHDKLERILNNVEKSI